MSRISDNEGLQSFNEMLPYLTILFDNEASFGITDKNKYLLVQNCESLSIRAKAGDVIPQNGTAFKAMATGKTLINDVPKEVYGVPFKSYAIPIKNHNNEVVGCIAVGRSLEKRNHVLDLSESLSASLEQISASVQNLTEGVQDIVESNESMLEDARIASENTKGTDDILNFVQSISHQTNLLGINAAIEAARAGEMGKGFGVVAKEIRKLSSSSSESIKQVNEVLRKIENSVVNITTKVNESSIVFESQASAFEQISASIQELSASAHNLEELSRKL